MENTSRKNFSDNLQNQSIHVAFPRAGMPQSHPLFQSNGDDTTSHQNHSENCVMKFQENMFTPSCKTSNISATCLPISVSTFFVADLNDSSNHKRRKRTNIGKIKRTSAEKHPFAHAKALLAVFSDPEDEDESLAVQHSSNGNFANQKPSRMHHACALQVTITTVLRAIIFLLGPTSS